MKILYVYRDFLQKGGMPLYSRSLAAGVAEAGHEVTVIAGAQPQQIDKDEVPAGLTVHEVPVGRAGRPAFRRCLRAIQPDLVHFTGGPRNLGHTLWSRQIRRAGIPYIVSGCGNLSELSYRYRWGGKHNRFLHFLAKKAFYYLFDRSLLRHAAAVHATSRNEAEIALRAGARDTLVVPFGNHLEPLPDPRTAQARSLRRPITFTYLGRLSPIHKGLDLIVEAFGKVVEAGFEDHFRLILAGTDERGSAAQLKRRAEELGISHVEFPGETRGAAKAQLWAESDFFLHLCRFNGFALAAREALCQGLPLIATRESDYGDWVYRYNLGLVVPPHAGALAEAILGTFRLSEATYGEWSCNVMEYVYATQWRTVGQMFAGEYERILAAG